MIYLAASVAWSDSSQMAKKKESKMEKEEREKEEGRNNELGAAYVNRQVKTMSAAQSDISKAHL